MLLYPVMLLFYQQNGLTAQELFFFQGIAYFVSIIAELPVGYCSNIFSRKHLLMISFLMYLGVTILWLLQSGYLAILLGEIIFGVSKTIMDNVMSGYLYDYLDTTSRKEKMPKYYGYLNCYLALGTSIAAIIGTFFYANFGIDFILISECFIISIIIALIASLPNIKNNRFITLKESIRQFSTSAKRIVLNQSIIHHILFSGLLTACSILFALSFQPLIQNSLLPLVVFGVVAFTNHFVRALAGFSAKKFNNIPLTTLSKILLALFSLAFILIISAFKAANGTFSIISITIICLFIGLQLIFTILNISRLHSYVPINNRGSLMSINNLISRSFAAIILITSKMFINKTGFENYFIIVFCIFFIVGTFLVSKINFKRK